MQILGIEDLEPPASFATFEVSVGLICWGSQQEGIGDAAVFFSLYIVIIPEASQEHRVSLGTR
jgi:hypothetical protein